MRKIIQGGKTFSMIRSLIYQGSFKKVERVLRAIRPIFNNKGVLKLDDKLIAKLRLSNSRRAFDLASFLNHFKNSHSTSLNQIYLENCSTRKSFIPKARGRAGLRLRRSYRFVALFA